MFTLEEILAAVDGRLEGPDAPVTFDAVSTDSRDVPPGAVFLCLRGEQHDGHAHAAAAIKAGARGVVASEDAGDLPKDVPVIRVADTLKAYGLLARAWRRKLQPRVIAVTGSSGKTSTKEVVAAYMAQWGAVHKSTANHNNEIGVPLTLLGLKPEHTTAVVEMGMRGPDEIGYLTDLAEPDVGIVTNVGSAHIGRLGSREAIAEAKAELWHHLPAGKTAVVPFDDALASRAAGSWGGRCVTFSLVDPAATVWSCDVHPEGEGQSFVVLWKAGKGFRHGRSEVSLPLWGDHHRANALAAIAAGWALGLLPPPFLKLTPEQLPGRARTREIGSLIVTDDTYNANPDSMRAAVAAFVSAPGKGRRFVVVGDMGELGATAAAEHRALGEFLCGQKLDGRIAVGEQAATYAEGCPDLKPFTDADAAVRYMKTILKPGDRLLFKASRVARFEDLIAKLQKAVEA